MKTIRRVFGTALLAVPLITGCKKQQTPPPPPPPEVGVITIQPQKVTLTTELPGRTTSYRVAEIRPQVSGLVQKRLFTEGAEVKAGDTLYQVDPAPFQAAYDSAVANQAAMQKAADRARAALSASKANLVKAQATVALAKTNQQRFEELFKERAVAASERDQAATDADVAVAGVSAAEAQVDSDHAAVAAADAAVKQAEAAVQSNQINLGYTKITAPISGKIGRSAVTEGAIVTAYQPLALATIQQLDPIYVDVPQSTAEMTRLRRSLDAGRLQKNGSDLSTVKLVLEDGTPYAHQGTLKFREVSVDPTTGSVILRVEAPNPDGYLLPGMFVRAVIEEGVNEKAILIPQQAVTRDPKGNPSALVVDAQDKVEQRQLKTERAIGDRWLVSSGLAAGDRLVVEGVQRARPGTQVKPAPYEAKAAVAGTNGAAATTAAKSN